jgi:uncharacterized protein YdiU (UPF0061 family)
MNLEFLDWQNRFVEHFPGDLEARNFTRRVSQALYSEVMPTPVNAPKLLAWSEDLGNQLGIDRPASDADPAVTLLSGNRVLPGMRPFATRYGGHQFGQWADQLGDGRAILLGEATGRDGVRYEFQLKGAGPTPYSRRADGRAVLRSSLREFLCSEAMHFLGIPTTRALSLVMTGDVVVRDMFYDGNPQPEPGAIVCRVSPSFLRFGHFEILSAHEETELLRKLVRWVVENHYPQISPDDPNSPALLLDEVSRRTATLLAHWMCQGFVHGVMNTDNMSILGLTIDYGPYGWLEPYDPNWTPNTTDAQGRRYRFGNQAGIAQWNLMRLAEALHPLIPDVERLGQSLRLYKEVFERSYMGTLALKLGMPSLTGERERKIAEDVFDLMESSQADLTIFFRLLSERAFGESPGDSGDDFIRRITPSFYLQSDLPKDVRSQWQDWARRRADLLDPRVSPQEREASMKRVNPKYVLRNYLAQTAIRAAEQGDLSVLERLTRVLRTPYDEQPADSELAAKRPAWAENSPGCSALSCSS